MKKLKELFKDNGFFAMAFAVVAIGLMSVIAIARIGVTDTTALVANYHALQEIHFLRSESERALKATPVMPEFQNGNLPEHVELNHYIKTIDTGFALTTFKVVTYIDKGTDVMTSLWDVSNKYSIKSLSGAYYGGSIGYGSKRSNVELYSEMRIGNGTFAGYHYFTEKESSTLEDLPGGDQIVKFWGKDEIWGTVRTNSDIYIQQAGGGNNNGWPTFHNHVYTSGEVKVSGGGSYPEDDVFLDGLTENLPELEFPKDAALAKNGIHKNIDEDEILFSVVDGRGWSGWIGKRIPPGAVDSVIIYDLAADGNPNDATSGDSIDVQYLPHLDTMWTAVGGPCPQNNSIYVTGELWIMGEFSGRQTWCSADTMFISGDILLSNTERGKTADGSEYDGWQKGRVNFSDIVGLVSEKSIMVQYGFRGPDDSIRYKYNCGNLTGEHPDYDEDDGEPGVFIYAALCALGKSEDGNSWEDGVFSFQYQVPHSSIFYRKSNQMIPYPDFSLFNNALLGDGWGTLHFIKMKGDNAFWPGNIGHIGYDPLWPEAVSKSYKARGSISLFGSVAQRRRGYIHRSGNSDADCPGHWDLNNMAHGIPANSNNPQIGPAPGVTGDSGVGYGKRYAYDDRFRKTPPPNFPEAQLKGKVSNFNSEAWKLFTADEAPSIMKEQF